MTGARPRRGGHLTGRRHRGREVALRVLFELDGGDKDPADAVRYQARDMEAPADVEAFAARLVLGCVESLEEVDRAIGVATVHWELANLGRVERAVLRLGAHELLHEPETPPAVVIDESVELAKSYAGQEAASFVNGVLGHIASGAAV